MKPLTIHFTDVKNEYVITLSEIIFIKVDGNYVDFHLDNQVIQNIRMTLTNVMELINSRGVFEVHHLALVGRKYIINFDKISALNYSKAELTISGIADTISLSRDAIKEAKDYLVLCNRRSIMCTDTRLMQLIAPLDRLNSGPKTCENGVEYVDLGLPSGLKWASCNIKGEHPGEWGAGRQWGVQIWTADLRESSYPHYDVKDGEDGKPRYRFNKTEMKPSMDAVHMTLKGGWHIPSKADFEELFTYCKGTFCFTVHNDEFCKGVLLEGTNGNSIFLPIRRDRPTETYYWTRDTDSCNPWAVNIPDEYDQLEAMLTGKLMELDPLAEDVPDEIDRVELMNPGKKLKQKKYYIPEGDITCVFRTMPAHFEMPLRPVTIGVDEKQ